MKQVKLLRVTCALLASLMLGGMVACDRSGDTSTDAPTGAPTVAPTDAPTAAPTEEPTAAPTEAPTEEPTEAPTEAPTEPVRTETVVDLYGNGYTNNFIVGFDEYGRSLVSAAGKKEDDDRQVGIFYFLWLGQHGTDKIYHIPTIREEIGDEALFHENVAGVSPEYAFHWWETPLYGYYNSGDQWVIRRHMEMLTEAGVDFLVFDTTNASIYTNVAKRVMETITEMRAEGWDAPQVTYMTNSYSVQTATNIYNAIYKENIYPEAWYRVDGKPMIITDLEQDGVVLADELKEFFYIRTPRWPNENVESMSWPYTEWRYPQPVNGKGDDSMVSVSVASHTAVPFSFSVSRKGNWPDNWGRGWDVKANVNVAEDVNKGTFFDSQWTVALKRDPHFIMITGWNEWVAQKNPYDGEYAFVDNFDLEYSRDIEPIKGHYEDAYYIQMMTYIRQYKYQSMEGKIADTVKKTIDVLGAATQWDDVNAIYRRAALDDGTRKANSAAADRHYREEYKQDPVRNDFQEVRVTVDAENIYFYIECKNDFVTVDEANWMNIFIGLGSAPTMKGWESYEFVINRSRTGNTATIEKLNADFSGETLEATATFSVQGNVMQVSVPRAALGLEQVGDFYFKVADGVVDTDEIMDYYVTGRSMPMGRLSYLYQIGNID